MIKHFLTRQFLGFLAVGGLAAFLHWLARIFLSIWMPFSWAVVGAYAVGMLVAFLLNSYFVFGKSERAKHRQAIDFLLINLLFFPVVWFAAIGINRVLLHWGMVRYTEALAHAIAVAVPTVFTFLIYKFFAFKEGTYGKP